MIRVSKHNISDISNINKINYLDRLFINYKIDLLYYIDLILSNELPLVKRMSSKLLPTNLLKHSKYKRDIYIKASEIIRSQLKKASEKRYKKYKYIYKYMIEKHPNHLFVKKKFKELKLKNIQNTLFFTKPNIKNISINLTNELFNIKDGKYFNNFVRITLPFFNKKGTRALKIKIPLKHHKYSIKLKKNGFTLRNNIQIKKLNNIYFIYLIWEQNVAKKNGNKSLGIDLGYKKLITMSNGKIYGSNMLKIYEKIANKKQGSKSFKRSLIERDNLINFYINQMNIKELDILIIENLKNVKHKSKINTKIMNKLQRWSYLKSINKLTSVCEENGINLVKVSPIYTSQTCSNCGAIHKESRNGETYLCIDCGFKIDADINAAINIHSKGVYSLFNQKK